MPLRYLFGPVTQTFAEQNLHLQRQAGQCVAFGPDEPADLLIRRGDSWEDVRRRFPDGWAPDFLVLNLASSGIPPCLWNTPLPRVGFAIDWHLMWHFFRSRLRQCDLVLTDAMGADVMAQEDIAASRANLFGCDRAFVEDSSQSVDTANQSPPPIRDIDVLFVGTLNPIIQRDRVPWLARLANLGRRWRVRIRSGVSGDDYRRLLKRARIVFQFSARGKVGRRAFEAANGGALIFQESTNRELPAYFRDRQECVYYNSDNFEELIDHYLEHEDERANLANAARMRARSCTFSDFWQEQIDAIDRDWPALRDRAGRPNFADPIQELSTRSWQAVVCGRFEDVTLLGDLERMLSTSPDSALVANMVGCMVWRQGRGRTPASVLGNVATEFFRKALTAQPAFALAALNLAESLDAAGHRAEAIQVAVQTLESLQQAVQLDTASADGIPLCQTFDAFHVGWEQAAWKAAGQPALEAQAKRDLILWKLHGLLAGWTGELRHSYESILRVPSSLIARAALGDALTRAGNQHGAVEHLRTALAENPLDRRVAHGLFQALGSVKDADARELLCEDRRLLSQAAPFAVPSEPWFTDTRPKGNELASIIVQCAGPLDRLRQCVDRLLRHSRAPFELILVDDGSDALVRAHLDEMRRKCALARVENVHAAMNLAFPQRCTLALAKSRGRFVAFLDSATLVTPGWLDSLVALSLHEWPSAGLVGPVSNSVPAPQEVSIDFQGVAEVDGFAARRRRASAGQMSQVNRLAYFCLLARRELLDWLGQFDQRFEGAAFAVADLCMRTRESGLRLLMAKDVFVHHDAQLKPQLESGNDAHALREKWGDQLSAEYEPARPDEPKTDASPTTLTTFTPIAKDEPETIDRRGVSLCMIVKNEEANLPECLRTVEGVFDEIIIADTGSNDNTREEARRFGARVFEFPWIDSFGAARNESLRHATCKWIMWLDADDRFDAENKDRLRKVLASLGDERDAYAITVRSVLDAERSTFRLLDQVRIFRNLPEIRWDYRIHEQILPSVNKAGGTVRWTDVIVDHVGYQDASLRLRKLERNLRLLQLDAADRPDDSFTLFNHGWTMLDLGKTAEALPRLQRSLETAKPDSSILRKLYHLLAVAQRQLGNMEAALKSCRDGLKQFPDDAELLLEEGLMLRDRGDIGGAELSWSRLFEPRQGKYFSSEDVGLRGFRTRQLLAEIYVRQERWTEAEIQWRGALEERLDFEPAWMGLADRYLRTSRWTDLTELLEKLEDGHIAPPKVGWLKARGEIQRREFAAAQKTLAEVIPQDPGAIGPRVLLSQALIQEGKNWSAAEKALRDILEIEPKNKDAKHNLQLVKKQTGRAQSDASSNNADK